jgi:hypothetical protein
VASHNSPSRGRGARGRSVSDAPEPLFSLSDLDPASWLIAIAIVAISLAPLGVMHLLRPGSLVSSGLLAFAVVIPFMIFAAMTLYFGRGTPVKARLVAAGLAVGGVAFGVFAGLTDYGQRAVTLFEVEVEGYASAAPGGPPVRELSFTVEHPGVEHTLLFWPKAGPLGAAHDAVVQVELRDAEGATLLAREQRFEPRSGDSGTDWGSSSVRFTPAQAGPHTLLVTAATPGTPLVHVRVEDPLKRDGVRPPGY